VADFSVRTTSPVTVLEIDREDFKDRMPEELMLQLADVALNKKLLKFMRVGELKGAAEKLKKNEDMHEFHQLTLWSLLRMHPHASQRIMRQLGYSFQLEGSIRTARYKDAINVGLVREKRVVPVDHASASVIGRMSSLASINEEGPDVNSEEHVRPGGVVLEVKKRVQALSPSGKYLEKELESRMKMLNQKLDALEEASAKRRPKHMKSL